MNFDFFCYRKIWKNLTSVGRTLQEIQSSQVDNNIAARQPNQENVEVDGKVDDEVDEK